MNLGAFFASFHRTAWRLETLPAYGTPDSDPSFARYLELGHLPPLEERPPKQAWMAAVRQAVADGKQVGRVYVARPPLSDFARYELDTYPENVAAGEDVRVADLEQHPELWELLDGDFWLLDDELVLLMDYDDEGRFLGLTPTRDPRWVMLARVRRDLAMVCSVPLAEYRRVA